MAALTRTSTISRGSDCYRIRGIPRSWDLAVWCDCALGPHWHHLDHFNWFTTAEKAIDEHQRSAVGVA